MSTTHRFCLSFWIVAADPRVAVAVPVSGMADLPSYVPNRVINGHCDCMFLHIFFQWPWAGIRNPVGIDLYFDSLNPEQVLRSFFLE